MINIVIPMAGEGKRFREAGYKQPKPLIDVCGKPMMERAISALTGNFVFIANNKEVFEYIYVNHKKADKIFLAEGTEGAACTVLTAKEFIDNENELIIADCDQYIELDFDKFIKKARKSDGCILTFNSTNPHHSYAKVVDGKVKEVAEKVVISDNACIGIYYYKKGSDFVKGAIRMINKNIRTNNEFYLCPIYNELIGMGKTITTYEVDVHKKHMLGTPGELRIFEEKVKNGEVKL